jgi:hypothetical protein
MFPTYASEAPRVVDPHNYIIPDVMRQRTAQRIGDGCYRTRPTTATAGEPNMNNWDVVMTADQEIARYVKS